MTDDKSKEIAARMAVAIETALPRIVDMWESFPYAEQDGDDAAIYELKMAVIAYRLRNPPEGARQ